MNEQHMSFGVIEYQTDGVLAMLSLNRPEKLNAINQQMVGELNQALDMAESDNAISAIVLDGRGRAFSAGFDLDTVDDDESADALRKELQRDFDIIMRFWESPKITVAAVHGHCLGSAMEMAVACDITVAADDSRFGAPEVKFGSGIVALLLPWFIGPKRSKELLLTGNDTVTAEQAHDYGLVNHVVPKADLLKAAQDIAMRISKNDQLAVRSTKQAINRSYNVAGMRDALLQALEIDIMVEATETDESREFNRILREAGAKAAIAWRDARLAKKS
jgi:enoyl-CoA hydratase